MRLFLIAIAGAAMALGGCSAIQTANAPVDLTTTAKAAYEAKLGYQAYLTVIVAYIETPRCTPASVKFCSKQEIVDAMRQAIRVAGPATQGAEDAVGSLSANPTLAQAVVVSAQKAVEVMKKLATDYPATLHLSNPPQNVVGDKGDNPRAQRFGGWRGFMGLRSEGPALASLRTVASKSRGEESAPNSLASSLKRWAWSAPLAVLAVLPIIAPSIARAAAKVQGVDESLSVKALPSSEMISAGAWVVDSAFAAQGLGLPWLSAAEIASEVYAAMARESQREAATCAEHNGPAQSGRPLELSKSADGR